MRFLQPEEMSVVYLPLRIAKRRDLSAEAKLVFACLLSFYSAAAPKSPRELGADCGLLDEQVHEALAQLRVARLIE